MKMSPKSLKFLFRSDSFLQDRNSIALCPFEDPHSPVAAGRKYGRPGNSGSRSIFSVPIFRMSFGTQGRRTKSMKSPGRFGIRPIPGWSSSHPIRFFPLFRFTRKLNRVMEPALSLNGLTVIGGKAIS